MQSQAGTRPLQQLPESPARITPAAARPSGALRPREREIAQAIAQRVIAHSPRYQLSVEESGLVDGLDRFLSGGKRQFAAGYRVLLWILELGALLPGFGMRPFSRLGRFADRRGARTKDRCLG